MVDQVTGAVEGFPVIVVSNRNLPDPGVAYVMDPSFLPQVEFDLDLGTGDVTFTKRDPLPGEEGYMTWLVQQEMQRIRDDLLRENPRSIVRITGI